MVSISWSSYLHREERFFAEAGWSEKFCRTKNYRSTELSHFRRGQNAAASDVGSSLRDQKLDQPRKPIYESSPPTPWMQQFRAILWASVITIVKPTRCTNVSNLFYFLNDTLHVSNGLSVHHQVFKTVHTATGICQTDTAVCMLVAIASRQQYLFDIWMLLYVQSWSHDYGRKDRPKYVECHSKIK